MAENTNKSGAFAGRDSFVYFALGLPGEKPDEGDYARLGMMRGKTVSVAWDTIDATADMSPKRTKETLVTFKDVSFSGDGVSRMEEAYNQSIVKRHAYNPGEETANQPYVWLKFVTPVDITEGCFTITSWEDSWPFDDVATWSTEAASAGEVDVRALGGEIEILTQPASATLIVGSKLTLTCIAKTSDNSKISYQWKKGGVDIVGATESTYVKNAVATGDQWGYSCVASSISAGSIESNTATITVNPE